KLDRARGYYEQNVSANPTPEARKDLADINVKIGETLNTAGRTKEAVTSFQRSLEVTEQLVKADPSDTVHQRVLHGVLVRLAKALYKTGNRTQAWQMPAGAKGLLKQMLNRPEQAKDELEQYCELLLPTPFNDLKDTALARRYADQLVEMTKQKDAYPLDLLAQAKGAAGDLQGAIQTEKQALQLLPPDSTSDQKKQIEKNLAEFEARAKRKQSQ